MKDKWDYCGACGTYKGAAKVCPRCGQKTSAPVSFYVERYLKKAAAKLDGASSKIAFWCERGAARLTAVGDPNSDLIAWSVASILLCNPISGAIGTSYSLRLRKARDASDLASAAVFAKYERIWLAISVALGLVLRWAPLFWILRGRSA